MTDPKKTQTSRLSEEYWRQLMDSYILSSSMPKSWSQTDEDKFQGTAERRDWYK